MPLKRSIFLSGPMGSGKSTVARAVADRLQVPAVDLDARIAEAAGASVFALFEERGEAAFRALEREQLRQLLAETAVGGPCVVALGGGTVVDERSRRRLLEVGTLVTLNADPSVLAKRVRHQAQRPLLTAGDPEAILREVIAVRGGAYAECHRVVGADQPVNAVADEVLRVAEDPPLVVPLGDRSYTIDLGTGRLARLAAHCPATTLVVTDENVAATPWAAALFKQVGAPLCVLEAGERYKTIRAVERIWDAAAQASLTRDGLLVAVGGGVIGDLAGFAASTWLRGVAFAQVPSTLLAMVDSSVGGKTGFDRREGKNLVGTFYQPRFVLCDPSTLSTLPEREFRAGLAEVVKSAWLDGEESVAVLEENADALNAHEPHAIETAVRRSIALKTRLVVADEREAGVRQLLNLGHTVGHALETAGDYEALLHGEAVSLGLVAAFRVGRRLGKTSEEQAQRMMELLRRLGLPTNLDDYLDRDLSSYWAHDKKRRGDGVGFIVPSAPGHTEVQKLNLDRLGALVSPDAG